MILATTDTLQGQNIKQYLGIVTAEVIYGSNMLRDFFAGLRDFWGGRTGSYERVFEKGQQDALKELQDRAQQLGANAIVGVQLKTDTINLDETGVLMLITASGTAVKI
ncbi:MAG: YbjQ family protein [Cyanobacteria bacterium J06627_3]